MKPYYILLSLSKQQQLLNASFITCISLPSMKMQAIHFLRLSCVKEPSNSGLVIQGKASEHNFSSEKRYVIANVPLISAI